MRLTISEIAKATNGVVVVPPSSDGKIIETLTWDSREVTQDSLYLALPGERVDGHDFVSSSLDLGAACVITTQPLDEAVLAAAQMKGAGIIQVDDTAQAIIDLAREWRTRLKGRVIALTGSAGKTTTKNLIRDVLASAHSVVATTGNQNNELGVPKTLLNAHEDTEVVVVEMGMRGLGQLTQLCEFVRPDWGLIVNVGESHIELLGSRKNVARAKAELLESLPDQSGFAFVNLDDEFSQFVCEEASLGGRKVKTVSFDGSTKASLRMSPDNFDGLQEMCRVVWAEAIELDAQSCPHFTLYFRGFDTPDKDEEVVKSSLRLRGLHNVANACAAAAVARTFGMTPKAIAEALSRVEPESGRQEMLRASNGATVINDAYNANPDSMCASLATFAAIEVQGRRIAVLGDMGELGSFANECHERVGIYAASLPIDVLVCVGDLANIIAASAKEAGMNPSSIVCSSALDEALTYVQSNLEPDDAVLLKASHFMGFEKIAEGLVS